MMKIVGGHDASKSASGVPYGDITDITDSTRRAGGFGREDVTR
jgi:hypothetical protein